MITMFLGGLWHGAGWTFIVWGVLHGFYLVINHAWRDVRKALGFSIDDCGWFWMPTIAADHIYSRCS